MSELPPSPPRSATPSRMWISSAQQEKESSTPQRSQSSASEHVVSGESTRATVTLLTNAAVTLVILWLSITVDWHLGMAVAMIVILRKMYLVAKAKFIEVTGWGGLKKKERSPSPVPAHDDIPAITTIPETPATPPPSPQYLEGSGFGELDYIEEENEEDLEEEEEELDDDDYDYSEEHSNPYENE